MIQKDWVKETITVLHVKTKNIFFGWTSSKISLLYVLRTDCENTGLLHEFLRRIVHFRGLLISKTIFINLARQIWNCSACIDLKIVAVACQLLRLFAPENEGDACLDLHIIKCFLPGDSPWLPSLGSVLVTYPQFRRIPNATPKSDKDKSGGMRSLTFLINDYVFRLTIRLTVNGVMLMVMKTCYLAWPVLATINFSLLVMHR